LKFVAGAITYFGWARIGPEHNFAHHYRATPTEDAPGQSIKGRSYWRPRREVRRLGKPPAASPSLNPLASVH